MNKGLLKNILIVLLLTIAIFCVFKYTQALKERYDLLVVLHQAQAQAEALGKEKQNLLLGLEKEKELQEKLSSENSSLKGNLEALQRRLTKLFRDIRETQNTLEELNSRYSLLKAENTALMEKEKQFLRENENLKLKLGSIAELKKAIREFKKQVRKVVSIAMGQDARALQRVVEGNHGFIIKDGKYTYPTKVKIEVTPVAVKDQEAKDTPKLEASEEEAPAAGAAASGSEQK